MVSFDIKSLFTNVTIKGTVQATLWMLKSE